LAIRICDLADSAKGRKFITYTEHCSGKCLLSIAKTLRNKQTKEMFYVQCQKSSNMNQIVNVTTSPLLNEKGAIIGIVLVVKDKSVSEETANNSHIESNKFHRSYQQIRKNAIGF